MFHCRSFARSGSRLAVRVSNRPARSQIRWLSQSSINSTLSKPSSQKSHSNRHASSKKYNNPKDSSSPKESHPPPRDILASLEGGPSSLGPYSIASQTEDLIQLSFEGLEKPIHVWSVWLRDICPCDACVERPSGQKRFSTHQIPTNLKFESVEVLENGDLSVKWRNDVPAGPDATHTSTYPSEFLLSRLAYSSKYAFPPHKLWNVAAIKDRLGSYDYSQYMQEDEGFGKALGDLWRDGIVILNDVPDSESAVEEIAQRIGPIQETIYGRTWDVKSKPNAENIAYTNEYLGPHQDLLYWSDIPRVQVLHCLRNDCEGGESLFVDGYLAGHHLNIAHPTKRESLSRLKADFAYNAGGHFLTRRHKVLGVEMNSSPKIAWSPPFQAPFGAPAATESTPNTALKKWHEAAVVFAEMLESKDRMFEFKLKPGQAVLFDNQRILHGRNRFNAAEGERWLKGTYLSTSALTDKVRQVVKDAPSTGLDYQEQTLKLCESEGISLTLPDVDTRVYKRKQ